MRTVAILNTNDEVVEFLRVLFENHEIVVVSLHLSRVRRGHNIEEFLKTHSPDVVLYDLAPPYDRSWRFYQHLRKRLGLDDRQVVLTTTNRQRVAEVLGLTNTCEIVGKPHDMDDLLQAVLTALERVGA